MSHRTSQLTKAQQDYAEDFLKQQAVGDACPVCRAIGLREAKGIYSLPGTNPSDPAERLVLFVCGQCSHALLFSASKMNLSPP